MPTGLQSRREGSPPRISLASCDADRHGDRHSLACAGDWRQHRDLFHHQQPAAAQSASARDPERLVLLTEGQMARPRAWSFPVWEQIRRRPELFERTAAWSFTRFNLASGGETAFVDG